MNNNQIEFKKTLHNPLEALFGNDFNQKRYKKKSDIHFNNILSNFEKKESKERKEDIANREGENNSQEYENSSSDTEDNREKKRNIDDECNMNMIMNRNNENFNDIDTKMKSKTIYNTNKNKVEWKTEKANMKNEKLEDTFDYENNYDIRPKRNVITERNSNLKVNKNKEKKSFKLIKQDTSLVSNKKSKMNLININDEIINQNEEYSKHRLVLKDRLFNKAQDFRKKSSDSVKNIVTPEPEDYLYNENIKFLNGEQIHVIEQCSLSFYYKNEYIRNEKI